MNKQVAIFISFLMSFFIFIIFFEIITPQQKENRGTVDSNKAIFNGNIKHKDNFTENNFSLPIEQEIQKCREAVVGFSDDALVKKQKCRESIENKHKILKEQETLIDLMKKKSIVDTTEKNTSSSSQEMKNTIAMVNALLTAQYFIILIYILLFITLWIQLFIAFSTKDKVDEKTSVMSDWAINSPPILGVVGTIYAFASFTLSSGTQKGLFEVFKNNFYDAATTTVIGGSLYVINFAILIWITSKVSNNSKQ